MRIMLGIMVDDEFTEVTVEHAGSVDEVQQQLLDNYSSSQVLLELMAGGDLKVLNNTPSECVQLGQPGDHLPAVEHQNLSDLLQAAHSSECTWAFVFMYGYWVAVDPQNRTSHLVEHDVDCTV